MSPTPQPPEYTGALSLLDHAGDSEMQLLSGGRKRRSRRRRDGASDTVEDAVSQAAEGDSSAPGEDEGPADGAADAPQDARSPVRVVPGQGVRSGSSSGPAAAGQPPWDESDVPAGADPGPAAEAHDGDETGEQPKSALAELAKLRADREMVRRALRKARTAAGSEDPQAAAERAAQAESCAAILEMLEAEIAEWYRTNAATEGGGPEPADPAAAAHLSDLERGLAEARRALNKFTENSATAMKPWERLSEDDPERERLKAAYGADLHGRQDAVLAASHAREDYLRAHPGAVPVYGAAAGAAAAGVSTVPVGGKKMPTVKWKDFQERQPSADEQYRWFSRGEAGMAWICGGVSGNLEMLEPEARAFTEGAYDQFLGHLADAGLGELWDQLITGCSEWSPGGGFHVYYRCSEPVSGNIKLARRLATEKELATNPKDRYKVLMETRGEGGYTVAAPSPGACHPSGRPWQRHSGGPASIVTITAEQREGILNAARKCDRIPADHTDPVRERHETVRGPARSPGGVPLKTRPGDVYNQKGPDWADQLEPRAWIFSHADADGTRYWTRPGKPVAAGHSATTGNPQHEGDRLHVFTSSTEFEPDRAYTKFHAYTIWEHDGDFAAAAGQLAAEGYKSEKVVTPVPPTRGDAGATWAAMRPIPEAPGLAEGGRIRMINGEDTVLQLRWSVETGRLSERIFLHNGELSVADIVGEDPGDVQLSLVTPVRMRLMSARSHLCYKLCEDREGREFEVPMLPSKQDCEAALASPDYVHVPVVRSVVHFPLLLPGEPPRILTAPGYDCENRLIYWPRHGDLGLDLSETAVKAARDWLAGNFLGDFGWVSDADLANYVALLLTPIVRHYVPRLLSPLGLINAHNPGSGKSYLVSPFEFLYGVESLAWSEDDEEIRKKLTTVLRKTEPVVVFDNVSRWDTVGSASLCKLLTEYIWDDRLLSTNTGFRGVNDRQWLVTGNNLQLGEDVPSRSLLVSIDPGMPDPDKRPPSMFRLGDLKTWLIEPENQRRLLQVLVSLVADWAADGAREVHRDHTTRFSRWMSIMTGITERAGFPGLGANMPDVDKHVGQAWSLEPFLEKVHAKFGSEGKSFRELCDPRLVVSEYWDGTWPTDRESKPYGGRALSSLLKRHDGSYFGPYVARIVRNKHKNRDEVVVEMRGDGGAGAPAPEPDASLLASCEFSS